MAEKVNIDIFYLVPSIAYNIKNSRRSIFYLDRTKRVWIKSECLLWLDL